MSVIPDVLVAAYLATDYQLFLPDTTAVLKVGELSPELATLYRDHRVSSAAFLTAFNPYSHPASEADNQRAQQSLTSLIQLLRLHALPGAGVDPSGRCPAEPRLLVLGISERIATAIARQYQQNAFLFAGPKLSRSCIGCIPYRAQPPNPETTSMLTNKHFQLSDAQLAKYQAWIEPSAVAAGKADALVSHSVEIVFSFSPFGRSVEARIPSSSYPPLILEE